MLLIDHKFLLITKHSRSVKTAFWDTAPCSLVEVDRRFGDACCLNYQVALTMEAVRDSNSMRPHSAIAQKAIFILSNMITRNFTLQNIIYWLSTRIAWEYLNVTTTASDLNFYAARPCQSPSSSPLKCHDFRYIVLQTPLRRLSAPLSQHPVMLMYQLFLILCKCPYYISFLNSIVSQSIFSLLISSSFHHS
jgi:hypothetical protein